MGWFGNILDKLKYSERNLAGDFLYELYSSRTNYSEKYTHENNFILSLVYGIIKDTGKLAKINLYENNKLKTENYLYNLKQKPNQFQTWTDFIEEYIIHYLKGTVILYQNNTTFIDNKSYYLLDFNNFDDKSKKLVLDFGKTMLFGNSSVFDSKHVIKYKVTNEKTQEIRLKDVTFINTNPNKKNWFIGTDKSKVAKKILSNSDSATDGKNVNLYFSQQYLLGQKKGKDDFQQQITGLSNKERDDIKQKVLSNQKLIVSGSTDLDLKRFVDSLKNIGYDESFLNDYMLIGTSYGIPIELLGDFLKGSSLTSQGDAKEKAMIQFVDFCLMPILQKLTDVLELQLNENQEVKAEFSHLWFMQYAEKQKAELTKMQVETLKVAAELGYDVANKLKEIYG